MGTEVKRIEKEIILKTIAEKIMPLEIRCERHDIIGFLMGFSQSDLTIEAESSWEAQLPELMKINSEYTVYFLYFGNSMMFKSKLKSISGSRLIFFNPEIVYKQLGRKYERIENPGGIDLSFSYTDLGFRSNFPLIPNLKKPDPLLLRKDFEIGKLSSLVEAYKKRAGVFVSETKVEFFKDRAPNSFEEKMIVKTGRIFLIPSVISGLPDQDLDIGQRMILRQDFIELLDKTGIQTQQASEQLKKYLQNKQDASIFAEMYCPIFVDDYVSGYVYLVNKNKFKYFFDKAFLEYTVKFSWALSFTLEEAGFFNKEKNRVEVQGPELIDISVSGIQFVHRDMTLYQILNIDNEIYLNMKVLGRRITLTAQVKRKSCNEKGCSFSCRFKDLAPEDFRFLYEFLYHIKYDERAEMMKR